MERKKTMFSVVINLVSWVAEPFWGAFCVVAGIVGVVGCLTYSVMQVYQFALPVQNLKTKYNAEWALVTGASSGIGKAIAIRLADQGISVVIAARDDQLLKDTVEELRSKYKEKGVIIRSVAVDLSCPNQSYMTAIIEGTKDIDVRLVFNNAGYMIGNLFGNETWSSHRRNLECLATCHIAISHHFLQKFQRTKTRGLIAFTSSASAYLFSPAGGLYSCSKHLITNFACTLATENRDLGIDVVAVHPGPINSNFTSNMENLEKLGAMRTAMKIADQPDDVAKCFFKAAGRLVIFDQGKLTMGFRLLTKVLDVAFLYELVSRVGMYSGDVPSLRKQKPKHE